MHFEPANKEKTRSVKLPLTLLVVWMVISTWYWLCQVKDVCDSSVLDATQQQNIDD